MNLRKVYPGFWHAVLLCVAFLGFQILFMIPAGIVDALLRLDLISHPGVLGGVSLLTAAVVVGMGWLIGRPPLREVFTFRRVSLVALAGVCISSAGMVILLSEVDNLLRIVLPPPEWIMNLMQGLTAASEHPWASLFLLVLVAPLTEEVLFRGLILRGFLTRFGRARAILWSALLFGAIHLNPWQFFSATGLGLVFGWWYVRSRSLIPCLLGHALANATVYAHQVLPFEIQGFNAGDMSGPAIFQPIWFDGLGVILLAVGCWLFSRGVPVRPAEDVQPGEPAPLPIAARSEPPPIPRVG